jgi:hypothetical protein
MREVRDLRAADVTFNDCPLSQRLMRWCKEALRLKKRWDELPDATYQMKASRLEDRLDALLRDGDGDGDGDGNGDGDGDGDGNGDGDGDGWGHPDARRLCTRLRRHRAELTRFLWDRKLDGTNNAAERALRPAVVMRKITGGSRSPAGAKAWATLASLLRTADQQGLGVFDATKKLIMEYWETGGR